MNSREWQMQFLTLLLPNLPINTDQPHHSGLQHRQNHTIWKQLQTEIPIGILNPNRKDQEGKHLDKDRKHGQHPM